MKVKEELQYIISKRNLELSNIKKYDKMERQIKEKNQKLKEQSQKLKKQITKKDTKVKLFAKKLQPKIKTTAKSMLP